MSDDPFLEPEIDVPDEPVFTRGGHNRHVDREACMKAIAAHHLIHGARNWREVSSQFPGVSDRRFKRWCAEVTSKRKVKSSNERSAKVAHDINERFGEVLPASVPPRYISEVGPDEARASIDLFIELSRVYGDAILLRETYTEIKEGKERIKGNPQMFSRQISLRLDIIKQIFQMQAAVWNLQRIESIYKTIMEIIVQDCAGHPDLQVRIMTRLQELNETTGGAPGPAS